MKRPMAVPAARYRRIHRRRTIRPFVAWTLYLTVILIALLWGSVPIKLLAAAVFILCLV